MSMYKDKYFTAIVLAAGKGSRMHSDIPKQYMKILGKEVLFYSLKVFQDSEVDNIVLVTRNEDIPFCKNEIVVKYGFNKVTDIIEGGSERYWSVRNGLECAKGSDYVLIHDGARPCINTNMIMRSMAEVILCGACTVGVPVKDTIKVVDESNIGIDTPDRSTLWQVQTPQSFGYNDLMSAYQKLQQYYSLKNTTEQGDSINITDDTMIMERYSNKKSKLIMGDYRNIKITTPEDILIAENYLNN